MFHRTAWLILFAAWTLTAEAQFPGGSPGGGGTGTPRGFFAGGIVQLFGENSAFTASIQVDSKTQMGRAIMPAKLAFLDAKLRFEMDATNIKGGSMSPATVDQIKAMGMAEVVTITLPQKKDTYLIYPGLKAYAVMTDTNKATTKPELKKIEQGKETIGGHPTVRYKVTIKDDQGQEQEALVWNATGLKDFPVKVQINNQNDPTVITFTDIKLSKPDEILFTPPRGFQRYNDLPTMMREVMMKRFASPGSAGPTPLK